MCVFAEKLKMSQLCVLLFAEVKQCEAQEEPCDCVLYLLAGKPGQSWARWRKRRPCYCM